MASPFGIRFFTTGYSKTFSEMSSVEKRAKVMSTGFLKLGKAGATAGPMAARGFRILGTGVTMAAGAMKTFLGLTLRVTAALGTVGAVVVGVGVALSTKFTKGLMATRETFYLIETALTGVVKNAAQVRKISEWAMRYAAEFPAMYSDVMDAMKGLAMMPSLKPIFTKASVADMEKIMNIVQSLAALDPQQGVRGALLAMREALAGQWRTLQMRFEIRPQAVAEAAGLSMDELKQQPDLAIKALDAFTRLNVGADTLRKSAESLEVQWGNLGDRYQMWLNRVAQYGAYRKLVTFLMSINDVWDKLLKSDAAERLGQDISRVFESAIAGMESAITGIDWEKAGIFGGILEAGRSIIDKVSVLFADAKGVLTASFEVALVYMKKALVFSVKNIFFPVGVAIGEGILAGLLGVLSSKKQRMVEDFKDVFVEPVKRMGMAQKESAAKQVFVEPVKRWWRRRTGQPEDVVTQKIGDGVPEKGKIAGIFETEAGAAQKNWMDKIRALARKWKPGIGERKDITATTPAEEQAKKVVEARVNLRMAEIAGTKQLVETLKSQLDYEERLFQYHKKAALWEADPKTGKRETVLKVETVKLKTEISKEISAGKTLDELKIKITELAKKEAELTKLTIQKEKTLGDVKRYTGIELERKALAAMKKQSDLKEKLLNTEKQIAKLKKAGGADASKLPDLERTLLDLAKQKLAIERKFTNAKKQQLDIQNKIQMMEMMKGGPGKIGISTLERSKGMFLTFKDWIEKEQKAMPSGAQMWSADEMKSAIGGGMVGQRAGIQMWSAEAREPIHAKMPGMMGMTWREGVTKSIEPETRGIPRFLLKMEEVLKEKLGRPDVSMPAQKSLLERLYGLNVEQFQVATGQAKGVQFLEANKFMERLMSVETRLQEEQIQLARDQAKNIATMVTELKTANGWLAGINGSIGAVGSQAQQISLPTPSDVGNSKITHSNPNTTTYESGGMIWEVMNR